LGGKWNTQTIFRNFCLVNSMLVSLLQTSCVGPQGPPPDGEPPFSVQPAFPDWLTGDVALLFTGVNSFTAKLEVQPGDTAAPDLMPPVRGELLGRDGNLLFIPETKEKRRGPPGMAAGEVSYLWNSQSNSAFVLNEPMQAYAPVSPNSGTNVFTVLNADERNHFPEKMRAANDSATVTLVFSKINFRPLPAEMFSVPDGFTRYASIEAMMNELAARQRSMMPRRMGEMPGGMPGGPGGRPPPGGGPP
jgi:hypothetical protein